VVLNFVGSEQDGKKKPPPVLTGGGKDADITGYL
jgi:hypothetical protein